MPMREKMTVQATLRIQCGGKVFGPGIARLLEGVRDHGSLRQSASEMGMSYNKAWHVVRESETRLGFPLLARKVGGARGGGAELTAQGAELLARYRAFETEAQAALAALAERHFEGMEGVE